MQPNLKTISDLADLISEKICLKIEKWNLYLGDAGLARDLAKECLGNLDQGPKDAAEIGLNVIKVRIGDGKEEFSLSKFVSSVQKRDLESILERFI